MFWWWIARGSSGPRPERSPQELARLNATLVAEGVPYILIGLGRWGSADPWLGIPVTWEQISGARVIVESGLDDIKVTPSQGSHFFQNLTSFRVGYFTVDPEDGHGILDWDWLAAQPAVQDGTFVRRLHFAETAPGGAQRQASDRRDPQTGLASSDGLAPDDDEPAPDGGSAARSSNLTS